jgi:ribose/xylose/arabinose/galactoside ABC-type transport system permease subunit
VSSGASEPTRTASLTRAFIGTDSAPLLVLLVLVLAVGGILVPHVFQVDNITNVLRSSAIVGLVAVGMTFVMITGEIDLSVGSIMSLSLVMGGLFLDQGSGVALLATALAGLVLGAINGLAVGYGRIDSLIMTLGTLAIYGGIANVVARGQAVYLYDSPAYTWTGKGAVIGLPVPLLIFLLVCLAGALLLGLTKLGRDIYYTGSNPVAAWYSGVNVAGTKVFVFALSGVLAALAGPLLSSQTNRITPNQGLGFELAAIAVAVLGGTALAGARGTVVGTLIGALIYGFLLNILALSGVETYTEQVLKGCLLIVVVLLFQRLLFRQTWRRPFRRSEALAR